MSVRSSELKALVRMCEGYGPTGTYAPLASPTATGLTALSVLLPTCRVRWSIVRYRRTVAKHLGIIGSEALSVLCEPTVLAVMCLGLRPIGLLLIPRLQGQKLVIAPFLPPLAAVSEYR